MKKILVLFAALISIISCSKDEFNGSQNIGTINASIEKDITTKISVNDDNSLSWSKGDAFTVFPTTGSAVIYTLSGNGGTSTGTFTGSTVSGDIKGAAFPFYIDNSPILTDNTLSITLPSESEFKEGICNSPMWAHATYSTSSLSFKHMMSLLKVQFNDIPQTAGQLIITASNPIAGKFNANINASEVVLEADTDNSVVKNKVVVKFTPNTLTNAKFLIPIPVGTYSTFALSYANADGSNETFLKYWNNLEFERATPNATTITIGEIDATLDTDYTVEGDTYTINTVNGLFWFANEVNSKNNLFSGKTVKLGNDINLNNVAWTPIGNESTKDNFHGTFDGNNHTISNLKVNVSNGAAGLFGYVQNCTEIKNLKIVNVDISANHYAGGIAGWFQENGSKKTPAISNCSVENGNITVTPKYNSEEAKDDYGDKVGGIIGYAASDSKITGCRAKDLTLRGYRDMGGILGMANSSDKNGIVELSNCTVENITIIQNLDIHYEEYIPTTIDTHCGRISHDLNSSSNTGTATVIVEIPDTKALFALAKTVNEGKSDFMGKTVKLTSNIDLENNAWTPIGEIADHTKSFRGKFDGNNKTISNFTINADTYAGFFGARWGAGKNNSDIVNVNFDRATVVGSHYGGVIVGWADGANRGRFEINNCHVTNSSVTLSVKNNDNGDKAGGIAGYFYACDMTNCSVTSTTIQGYRDLGGLVGIANENRNDLTGDDYAIITHNAIGENVTIKVDKTNNYNNYTDQNQYNLGNWVGKISARSVVKDNTGAVTIEF